MKWVIEWTNHFNKTYDNEYKIFGNNYSTLGNGSNSYHCFLFSYVLVENFIEIKCRKSGTTLHSSHTFGFSVELNS